MLIFKLKPLSRLSDITLHSMTFLKHSDGVGSSRLLKDANEPHSKLFFLLATMLTKLQMKSER